MKKRFAIYVLGLATLVIISGLVAYDSNIVEGKDIAKENNFLTGKIKPSLDREENLYQKISEDHEDYMKNNLLIAQNKTNFVTLPGALSIDIGDGGGSDISLLNDIDGSKKYGIGNSSDKGGIGPFPFIANNNVIDNSLNINNNNANMQGNGTAAGGGGWPALSTGAIETTMNTVYNRNNKKLININTSTPEPSLPSTSTLEPSSPSTSIPEPSSLVILGSVSVLFGFIRLSLRARHM